MASKKGKVLQALFWICIFAVYFSSELILRVYYIYGEGNSKEQMEALANKLPGFLKDSLKSRQRLEEAQKNLEEAKKGADKNKLIDAYYTYANELANDDRDELYKELLEKYPKDLKCNRAFMAVMNAGDEKYNLDGFLKYIKDFSKKDKTKLVTQAWYKVKNFSDEDKKKFINHVIAEEYTSGEMFSIFNEMMTIRFNLKMPISIEKKLEELKAKSFEQYKRLQKQLLKNRDKKN